MMPHPRYLALSATHKNEQSQVTTSLIPSLNSILQFHSSLHPSSHPSSHPSLHPSLHPQPPSLTPIFKPHPSNSSLIPPPKKTFRHIISFCYCVSSASLLSSFCVLHLNVWCLFSKEVLNCKRRNITRRNARYQKIGIHIKK